MPIYEYFCQDCEKKFEIEATLSEKEKGLEAKCSSCDSNKTVQIFSSFFTFSKGKESKYGSGRESKYSSGCGPNPTPGCCG